MRDLDGFPVRLRIAIAFLIAAILPATSFALTSPGAIQQKRGSNPAPRAVVYDAWTPARAYQHYHGGIRIQSETASARIASPTIIPFDKLTPQVGVDTKTRSWNFPVVWPGGEWKLANIVDYMQAGAFALMRNAARYRERWLRDFYRVGKDAVRERKIGEPFAFLIPPLTEGSFWQIEGRRRLVSILARGEVEMLDAPSSFEADGKRYPAGSANR